MNYENLSKEQLIKTIQSKDRFIESFMQNKEEQESLQFAWTENLGQWFWDVQKNIVKFNTIKATNLGYSKSEIPENCGFEFFTDKLHPDDYPSVMQNMRNHLSGDTNVYEVEYRIKTKNGDWKWYYDRGKITKYDQNKQPAFLSGIVFDISERKNHEEKQNILIESLSEQLSLKENLFSTIFHDLKNPLSNLKSVAELIRNCIETNGDIEKLTTYSEILNHSSDQALKITDNMMEWIRAKNNSYNLPKEFKLKGVIESMVEELKNRVRQKNIHLSVNIPEDIVINSNRSIIKIAARNFLSNAIKFTNPGGNIVIRYINGKLEIADDGIGIPEEKMKDLFRSSLSPSLGTQKERGNGIGLLLVKELLDKINVTTMIDSQVNKGTTIGLQFL